MNATAAVKHSTEEIFFLTELLGVPVYFNDRRVGKLQDLAAVDRGNFAEVTHFQIARPFGDAPLMVPSGKVRFFNRREVVVENGDPKQYVRPLLSEEVLLRDYLLDKKVLDTEDREVEVVYDIRLVLSNNKMYVSDVDISRFGLLRQIGLRGLANYLYERAAEAKKKLIPWSYVQPLPPNLDSLRGNLKLSILREQLAEIHPADLADILEQLDSSQRVKILEQLDTERASDTLEEVEPAVQRDIVFAMNKAHVAQLIGEMTPGQAADLVGVLPAKEKRTILELLQREQAAKIKEILENHEMNILNFATRKFPKFPPEMTVKQAREQFREMAKSMDVGVYFYIVAESNKLLGVADVKELLTANDDEMLKNIVVEKVICLNPESTMREAMDTFIRYGFRALPVTDKDGTLLGVVPYQDVMNLRHRILD
jgi:magnesium transporter